MEISTVDFYIFILARQVEKFTRRSLKGEDVRPALPYETK
jgi:hypothetical protein